MSVHVRMHTQFVCVCVCIFVCMYVCAQACMLHAKVQQHSLCMDVYLEDIKSDLLG